ncbi:MAG: M20/M25/M40 family metallo-hydrolase [Oscillospiraceae bacterium]|nr:M20/M25/M40 family metallo-hydrolase [Oscillospiraceae bacterium]
MQSISETLKALSNLSSFQGEEALGGALDELKSRIPAGFEVSVQGRNLIAQIGNPSASQHILLDAHLDEISFTVTHIEASGFLHIAGVGGIDRRTLLGAELTVWGKRPIKGIVCCQPPHLTKAEDYAVLPKVDEVFVDIGYSYEEACELVSVGDKLSYSIQAAELQNNIITGKSLDDRAGCCALLRAAELLAEELLPDLRLTLLFSGQEETGEQGATTAAFALSPTQAIAVDVSFAKSEGCPPEKCSDLCGGPILSIAPVLSKGINSTLKALAEKAGIVLQLEVSAESSGCNADAISLSKSGIPCAALFIPLCYMHTPVETVHPDDIEATARLLADYVLKGGSESA